MDNVEKTRPDDREDTDVNTTSLPETLPIGKEPNLNYDSLSRIQKILFDRLRPWMTSGDLPSIIDAYEHNAMNVASALARVAKIDLTAIGEEHLQGLDKSSRSGTMLIQLEQLIEHTPMLYHSEKVWKAISPIIGIARWIKKHPRYSSWQELKLEDLNLVLGYPEYYQGMEISTFQRVQELLGNYKIIATRRHPALGHTKVCMRFDCKLSHIYCYEYDQDPFTAEAHYRITTAPFAHLIDE